jgi:hypothetical protein
MRFISTLLLLLSFASYGESQDAVAIGSWECEPYTIDEGEEGIFDVTHTVEYRPDGSSTDIHTYKLRGMEEQVWLKVSHSGPWKIQGKLLIEETESTEIIDASIPDLKQSEEMLQAVSFEGTTFISDIIELSKSKFITKDKEIGEASTCVKV